MRVNLPGSAASIVAFSVLAACQASIDGPTQGSPPGASGSSPGGGTQPSAQPGVDPGRVGIHRLNNTERRPGSVLMAEGDYDRNTHAEVMNDLITMAFETNQTNDGLLA